MSAFLQNSVTTLQESFTLLDALYSLPPAVIDHFWQLTNAATAADARARACDGADRGPETLLLVLALKLYRDALKDAAIPDDELEQKMTALPPGAEPELLDILLNGGYFHEITRFMTRIVQYSQKMLRQYDPHPSYVMDLNMVLNAVERLSGYTPFVPASRDAPTALPPAGNPKDQDFMFLARSIAGEPSTWFETTNPFSEFNMLKPLPSAPDTPRKADHRGRFRDDLIRYLTYVWAGSDSRQLGELMDWQRQAWDDEQLNPAAKDPQEQPAEIALDKESQEIWFFINGVVTDHWIAQLNAEYLAEVFKRRIHILHNLTQGLDRDLRECVRGRLGEKTYVAKALREKLQREANGKGRTRVVLVAHSEGTIIASDIVRHLPTALLDRMEIYNFAFCADQFPAAACRRVEHIVNERDLVPSLSIVPENYYNVPGRIFRQPGKSGHFLGAHYLPDFTQGKYRDAGGHQPALFQYIGGANYGRIVPSELLTYPHRNLAGSITWNSPQQRIACEDPYLGSRFRLC